MSRRHIASAKSGPAFPAPTQLEQQLTASLEMVAIEKHYGARFTVPSISEYALGLIHDELDRLVAP